MSTKDIKLTINIIAPPKYYIQTQCINQKIGIEVLEKGLKRIEEEIQKVDGIFEIIQRPSDTSNQELDLNYLIDTQKKTSVVAEEDNSEGINIQI